MNSTDAPKRFCRRCKKVRSPEEPPDIQKYKTCKVCREIERKKKRLKKLNSMATVDSNLVNDALNYTKMLPNLNEQIQQHHQQQQQQQQQYQQTHSQLHHHHQSMNGNNGNNNQSPSPSIESDLNINEEIVIPLNECEICGKTRNNQDNGRYKLCEQCLYDPTSNPNVESDFNQYLIKLNKNSTQDVHNLIFYKNIPIDILPIPIDNLNPASVEYNKRKCEMTLNNINSFFIKPIMNVTGFQFSRTSSNLSIKPYPKTLKALYRCKQDLKTSSSNNGISQDEKINYRVLKNQNCDSYLYISFDLITRLLTIKFSHKTHRNFLYKNYSNELISIIIKNFEQGKKNNCIYNDLKTNSEYQFLANEISMIRKTTFLRDFNNDFLSNELLKLKHNNDHHQLILKNLIENQAHQKSNHQQSQNDIYYNLDPEISNLQEKLLKNDGLQSYHHDDHSESGHMHMKKENMVDDDHNVDPSLNMNNIGKLVAENLKNSNHIMDHSTQMAEIDPLLNQ